MKRTREKEFSALHLFLGLLLGFLLGSSLVYWHTTRQNDRLISESINQLLTLFDSNTVHLETGDSLVIIAEKSGIAASGSNENTFRKRNLPNEYQIEQDRLIYATTIDYQHPNDSTAYSTRMFDTLMGVNSSRAPATPFTIEFWESPFNSLGYKMGKNKLILYGIKSYDMVSLVSHREKTYLKYVNEYFPLEITSTFKPLISSNDHSLPVESGPY